MTEAIDLHVVATLKSWHERPPVAPGVAVPTDVLLAYFDAQLQSRHLDFAARWMQTQGRGYYTIGSAGHESNAAVALATRPTDPALLHYRSGGFYAARAGQAASSTAIRDVLLGVAAAAAEPISGGRHKVFGHHGLNIIPQTSTIASHLPRAFGLAFALARAKAVGVTTPWPDDAIVVGSIGDASLNHSTTAGALNAVAYCVHAGMPVPLLLVCEDNGIGISTPSPSGWVSTALSGVPGVECLTADGADPADALNTASRAAAMVRTDRRPVLLHLRTVRFMGHAGSDAEVAYRSSADITADYDRDPLLAAARALVVGGHLGVDDVVDRYEAMRERVMTAAAEVITEARLTSADEVMAPLTHRGRGGRASASMADKVLRENTFGGQLPERQGGLTLAQSINASLTDVMASVPEVLVFGEDVGRKGGVYGVTRGLQKRFGARRVFDTLLDEQTILGTALGAALAGFVPIPEIQYLAYLHNAEDQLRGEAASLRFFSNRQYANGMVVRIAGLAYQKGFGGHFHNDNSLAVLRDIPGLVLVVPSHPADVPALMWTCVSMAREEGRVCVVVEPIALYHTRDLHPGDGLWLAQYSPAAPSGYDDWLRVREHRSGSDLLIITFGNGLPMSLRAAQTLSEVDGIEAQVIDLRWLAPLPNEDIVTFAAAHSTVLIVDETRCSGGVSESVLALLVDADVQAQLRRVTSRDSFVPLGAAANLVLVSEADIVAAARAM